MKKTVLQNIEISRAIAAIGHTQSIAIGDLGLPIPPGVPCIDLSLVRGVPTFKQVVDAVLSEMCVESFIVADELADTPDDCTAYLKEVTLNAQMMTMPHADFKKESEKCSCIIRTGECTPYYNVILVSGVDFGR